MTGAGPVGLLAAATARAFGALSVRVSDVSPYRLDLATSIGFETEHPERAGDASFDVLLECSGAPGVLGRSLTRLRPAGRAAMIGMSQEEAVALPLSRLNVNEITLSRSTGTTTPGRSPSPSSTPAGSTSPPWSPTTSPSTAPRRPCSWPVA